MRSGNPPPITVQVFEPVDRQAVQSEESDMKKIDFEAHFVTEALVEAFYRNIG